MRADITQGFRVDEAVRMHCVFNSQFLMRQACERGCPAEKSRVIYRGCVIPTSPPVRWKDSAMRFACVGNFLPVKGHRYLVEAFACVKRHLEEAELLLIGSGPLEIQLRHLVQEIGLGDSVVFKGSMMRADVHRILSTVDIYVQPSVKTADGREEGLPNATVEAQAMGLPAVVFRTGGLGEVVEDGQTGIMVAERDVEAMAKAMVLLARNGDMRLRMSEAGFRRVNDKFNIEKQNLIWRRTITELMH